MSQITNEVNPVARAKLCEAMAMNSASFTFEPLVGKNPSPGAQA